MSFDKTSYCSLESNETSRLLSCIEILFNCSCYYINIEKGLLKIQRLESYFFLLQNYWLQVQSKHRFHASKTSLVCLLIFLQKNRKYCALHIFSFFLLKSFLFWNNFRLTEQFQSYLQNYPKYRSPASLNVVHLSKLRHEHLHNIIT